MSTEQQIDNLIPLNNAIDCQTIIHGEHIYYSSNILITPNFKIIISFRRVEPLAGYLQCPGGKIKYKETPRQAARRETFEETDLDLEENRIHYINTYKYSPSPFGQNKTITKRTVYTFYTVITEIERKNIKNTEGDKSSKWHKSPLYLKIPKDKYQ